MHDHQNENENQIDEENKINKWIGTPKIENYLNNIFLMNLFLLKYARCITVSRQMTNTNSDSWFD